MKNIATAILSLAAVAAICMPALADQPLPTENYGQCQGGNRHQLSAYQDWADRALAAELAQLAPDEVAGPGIGDLLPDERPNARADVNALLTNKDGHINYGDGPQGCYAIKPGQ